MKSHPPIQEKDSLIHPCQLVKKDQPTAIRDFLLQHIPDHPKGIIPLATSNFLVARTTIFRHLQWLLNEKEIIKIGNTSSAQYFLKASLNRKFSVNIFPELSEAQIWIDYLEDTFCLLPKYAYEIFRYAFSRTFNNVMEHSKATEVEIQTLWEKDELTLKIQDNGIGIFDCMQKSLSLSNERECVIRLATEKVTTSPEKHGGQGLFFTSRAVDQFMLRSGNIHFYRNNRQDDWTLETHQVQLTGTTVSLSLAYNTRRRITEIFKKYSTLVDDSDPRFDKIHILVELCSKEILNRCNRQNAKKLLQGVHKYRHVLVDFKNVNSVTQGFVDEVFRLFQARYPQIEIKYTNANDDVKFMIEHTLHQKTS